jgi:hypothetical protein
VTAKCYLIAILPLTYSSTAEVCDQCAAALNIDRIVNWLNGVPSSDFLLIPEIIPRFKYLKPYISNQIWAAVKSQPCALYGEKLNA